jgi:hypothetical protein
MPPASPPAALFRSINKAGRVSEEGLSGRTVANLVKRYAAAAGFDATEFSGHSVPGS